MVVPPNAEDEDIIFVENRPSEAGRAALIHTRYRELKDATDLTQGKYNARTGIHEYGGGAAAALADGSILFSDYDPKSFNVLRTKLDGSNSPQVVTPENPVHRFGDFGPHPTNPNLALTILEDHTIDEPSKVVNSLACIDMSTSPATISTLMVGNNTPGARYNRAVGAGRDFYTFPRFSPNGKYVAWVSWDHPSMPFWATELWVARFEYEEGFPPRIFGSKKISVGATGKDEVLQQPVWGIPRDANSSTSELFFTSDNTNFNNLYSVTVDLQDSTVSVSTPKSVLPEPVPRDFSEPAWVCNNSDYVPLTPDMLVVTATRGGRSELGLINLRRPRLISLKSPFVTVSQLRRLSPTSFVLVAGRSDEPPALVTVDLRGLAQNGYEIGDSNVKVIKRTSDLVHEGTLTKDWLSRAEEIEFPTTLPDGSASTSHALVFPPCNPHFTAPSGSAPPCMVTVHGGPTSASSAALSLSTQFWTTRGWMVCAVNYGGSTGYGRDFMERLNGQWGVVDVRDVVAAAEYLGSAGSAKPFGSLKASEATKLRTDLAQVRAERSALTEQVHDNNAIEFTLRNTAPVWSWKDAVFGLTAAAAAAAAAPAGLLLSGGVALAWLVKRARRVESESVTAIPGVGLQLSTTRALRLSASFSTLTTRSTRLIPRDDLLDLHVAEGFRLWSVFDYLSLVKRDGSIRKLFPVSTWLELSVCDYVPSCSSLALPLYPCRTSPRACLSCSASTDASTLRCSSDQALRPHTRLAVSRVPIPIRS